jgi:hypothetical protein
MTMPVSDVIPFDALAPMAGRIWVAVAVVMSLKVWPNAVTEAKKKSAVIVSDMPRRKRGHLIKYSRDTPLFGSATDEF